MSLFMNKFFCLGSACLLNEPTTKAQAWFIYKQTNMNKLFIEPSSSCSWSAWFIYSPMSMLPFPFFFPPRSCLFFFFIFSFFFDFLSCGCDSCFVFVFCLTRHDFYFLINWVIAFFFFGGCFIFFFVLIGHHFFNKGIWVNLYKFTFSILYFSIPN